MPEKYLTRPEAARYVVENFGAPCTYKSLCKYATVGGGPVYRKFGNRVLYAPADLATWVHSKLSAPRQSSTVAA